MLIEAGKRQSWAQATIRNRSFFFRMGNLCRLVITFLAHKPIDGDGGCHVETTQARDHSNAFGNGYSERPGADNENAADGPNNNG